MTSTGDMMLMGLGGIGGRGGGLLPPRPLWTRWEYEQAEHNAPESELRRVVDDVARF